MCLHDPSNTGQLHGTWGVIHDCVNMQTPLEHGAVHSKKLEDKVKVQVFDTPQVVDCFKVESDAA